MSQQVDGGDDLVSVHPPSEKELRRPPPSDDLYFKSYAHLGIHQEMIRVRSVSIFYLLFQMIMENMNVFLYPFLNSI